MAGRLAEEPVDQALAVRKGTFATEVTRRAADGVLHELFFGQLLFAAVDQLQGVKTLAQPVAALFRLLGQRAAPHLVDCRQKWKLGQNLAAGIRMQIEYIDTLTPDPLKRCSLRQGIQSLDRIQMSHTADEQDPLELAG